MVALLGPCSLFVAEHRETSCPPQPPPSLTLEHPPGWGAAIAPGLRSSGLDSCLTMATRNHTISTSIKSKHESLQKAGAAGAGASPAIKDDSAQPASAIFAVRQRGPKRLSWSKMRGNNPGSTRKWKGKICRWSPAKNSERLGIWGDLGDGAYSELPGFALDRRKSWRFRAQGREESFVDAGAVIPSRIERRGRCAPTRFRALPMTRATCSATVSTA